MFCNASRRDAPPNQEKKKSTQYKVGARVGGGGKFSGKRWRLDFGTINKKTLEVGDEAVISIARARLLW